MINSLASSPPTIIDASRRRKRARSRVALSAFFVLFCAFSASGLVTPPIAAADCPGGQKNHYNPPTASASLAPRTLAYGNTVSFSASSTPGVVWTAIWVDDTDIGGPVVKPHCEVDSFDDPVQSYTWNFGDGNSSTQSPPSLSHVYAAPGTYSVSLTVTTQGAHTLTVGAGSVVVSGPVAAFSASAGPLWTRSFDAGASAGPYRLADFTWDFGDGSAAARGVTVTHTYTKAGPFNVTLTVRDVNGRTATGTNVVTVQADSKGPLITITKPGADDSYVQGDAIRAAFSCTDPNGSGFAPAAVDSCVGTVKPDSVIDTAGIGDKSFTVTSRDAAGNRSSVSVLYHVRSRSSPADSNQRSSNPGVNGPSGQNPAGHLSSSVLAFATAWPSAVVTVGCQGPTGQTCKGAMTLEVRAAKRAEKVRAREGRVTAVRRTTALTIGRGSYKIAGGHTGRFRISLNAAGRRELARLYRLSATLVLSGTAATHQDVSLALPRISVRMAPVWEVVNPPGYTRIVQLQVGSVPAHARVTVRCRGHGCPFVRRDGGNRRRVELAGLFAGARMGGGTVIQVEITRSGQVGEVVVYQTRAGGLPVASALCLPPGYKTPAACR